VFALLEREFEISDVRAAVAEAIRPARDAKLDAHRVLLDLATSRGATRLITTNFAARSGDAPHRAWSEFLQAELRALLRNRIVSKRRASRSTLKAPRTLS
jgi:hypothetical protein